MPTKSPTGRERPTNASTTLTQDISRPPDTTDRGSYESKVFKKDSDGKIQDVAPQADGNKLAPLPPLWDSISPLEVLSDLPDDASVESIERVLNVIRAELEYILTRLQRAEAEAKDTSYDLTRSMSQALQRPAKVSDLLESHTNCSRTYNERINDLLVLKSSRTSFLGFRWPRMRRDTSQLVADVTTLRESTQELLSTARLTIQRPDGPVGDDRDMKYWGRAFQKRREAGYLEPGFPFSEGDLRSVSLHSAPRATQHSAIIIDVDDIEELGDSEEDSDVEDLGQLRQRRPAWWPRLSPRPGVVAKASMP